MKKLGLKRRAPVSTRYTPSSHSKYSPQTRRLLQRSRAPVSQRYTSPALTRAGSRNPTSKLKHPSQAGKLLEKVEKRKRKEIRSLLKKKPVKTRVALLRFDGIIQHYWVRRDTLCKTREYDRKLKAWAVSLKAPGKRRLVRREAVFEPKDYWVEVVFYEGESNERRIGVRALSIAGSIKAQKASIRSMFRKNQELYPAVKIGKGKKKATIKVYDEKPEADSFYSIDAEGNLGKLSDADDIRKAMAVK